MTLFAPPLEVSKINAVNAPVLVEVARAGAGADDADNADDEDAVTGTSA